ncbi:MAG TPA: alkaline phosphatase family protein [Tepidisphaeraceae bacterium]|jgi:phospholipase C|nr:alkaline phosphatase family protein [Tepidisphaeraceae bacterium]
MPTDLANIKTVIIVMMENRSFDHMLGYLSLPPWSRGNVDGLRTDPAWLAQFANVHDGKGYQPFHLSRPNQPLPGDPPHDRADIATQLDGPMTGFVNSCATADPVSGNPVVMGYFNADDLPTTHFFAQQFAICDHWFSAIPASTQPNRLMAMSGTTLIDDNVKVLPEQSLVYDWLEGKDIKWRVYHQGLPFFALMASWMPYLLMDYNFRELSRFADDIQNEADEDCPQVIFIEPRYTDAPHVLPPTDDHAPSPVSNGQQFLAEVYSTAISNPDRWKNTVMIITYDEHGGFFDHVSPIAVKTAVPGDPYPAFTTSGVRVPGIIVSPWVDPGQVYNGPLDHTSILKFLGELFNAGTYSNEVDARTEVGSVSAVLNRATPRDDAPLHPSAAAGQAPGQAVTGAIPQAFEAALDRLRAFDKDVTKLKFPTLFHRF